MFERIIYKQTNRFVVSPDLAYFTILVPDTNDTSATRMKNFDIDNDTSESMLAHPRPYFMASKRLQGEEQFHSKNYILEMPCSHAKMCLKSASQKLNFVLAKAISKSYTLDCSSK